MNGFLRLLLSCMLTASLSLVLTGCQSMSSDSNDEANTSSDLASDNTSSADEATAEPDTNSEAALDKEVEQAGGPVVAAENSDKNTQQNTDEFKEFEDATQPEIVQEAPVTEAPPAVVETAPVEAPPAVVEVAPPETPPMVDAVATAPEPEQVQTQNAQSAVKIKDIQYRSNDSGGTVVIDADGPMNYQSRINHDTNQFIIEIADAKLPAKLKRNLNTKDIKGAVGSVDAYQNPGSNMARIVIQLRQGVSEPTVQNEGNSLLVVHSINVATAAESTDLEKLNKSQILSTLSLEEFLSGNMKFYGKKISIETSDMDIRDVFKLISEESGMNMIISDQVKGPVSVKLRDVPWDQALVAMMKTYKLAYTRSGNIIRITQLDDLKKEEEQVVAREKMKADTSPLKVRMIPVSYAKIEELVAQVKPFLSERGKLIGDPRTSSMVISDLDENIERVMKLVSSIDIAPAQVLIEGKVVEASDDFQRTIGVNWNASGRPVEYGRYSKGAIKGTTSIATTPGSIGNSAMMLNFSLGTLDILGNLSATLALFEQKNQVKVLSSPRIVTLHNEAAEINQTTEVPLMQQTIINGDIQKTVTFKSVKLRLAVTPQVTNDGAVIMQVDVNRDFLGAEADQATAAKAVNSRQAKTKVLVKNGQTAVIGGIYQSDSSQGEGRVPWLSDIPLFGWLFKNRSTSSNKNELMIFLTPRILGQLDAQSASASNNQSGELE